jgi:putative transposase
MGNASLPVRAARVELPSGQVRKRRRSVDAPRHAHEITCSCYHRLKLLNHDRTRRWLVEALSRGREVHGYDLMAYVIMPDHFHALLLPRRHPYAMAGILKTIKQPVARRAVEFLRSSAPEHLPRLRVQRPDGRIEHRFWQQGGGYDRNLWEPEALQNSVRYIHQNPVEACLCEKAEDWLWSSARWYSRMDGVVLQMDRRPPPILPRA